MAGNNNNGRKRIFLATRIIIAILLLVYLVNFIKPDVLLRSLKNSDFLLLSIGVILVIPLYYFQYDKWKLFCSQIISIKSGRQVFHSLMAGISAGIVTPMRLGEHLGRILILNESKKSDVIVLSVTDKFIPHIFYPIFGLVAYYIYLADEFPIAIDFAVVGGIALPVIISVMIFRNRKIRNYLKRFELINSLWESISLIKKFKIGQIIRVYFDSLMVYTINIAQYALLIWAFTGNAQFIDYFFGAAFIFFFKSLLPVISIGDLGVREFTAVYFLAYFSVGEAEAFNASVLLAIINLFIPATFSLLLFKTKP